MYTLTTYNIHQGWDPILAAMSVLITYIFHYNQLYLKGLDTYTSCTVHEQDSVITKHERTNYMYAIVHVLYRT